jgi:hypothetical protein
MADWQKIKTEYITTQISYRALEKKYGINYKVIADKGKKEGWSQLRSQHRDKTLTKTLDTISNQQVDRAANLISVADQLLAKVQDIIEMGSELLVAPQNLKHLSGVLKDIKDIQMIRSDADMREQEARIANLRKQAEKEDNQSKDVTITIEGGDPKWQS